MAKQNQRPVYEEQAPSSGAPLLKVLFSALCFGLAVLMVYLTVAQPLPESYMHTIQRIMRGLCGSVSPLLAVLMVYIGVLLVFALQGKRIRVLNIIMNGILFLLGFTVVQLFCARDIIQNHMSITTFANFVAASYRQSIGGGAIGALLAYPLYMFDQWGGLIIIIFAALICLLATGKAQKFYRWTRRRAEEGQHHMDQRRKQKDVERMFDYDRRGYDPDEYDHYAAPPRRPAQPRPEPRPQRPPQPQRRARDPQQESMIIDTPIPAPQPAKKAAARKKLLHSAGAFVQRIHQLSAGAGPQRLCRPAVGV